MTAVIIDDEQDSRDIIEGYLTRYCPDVEVLGFGKDVPTGVDAIRQHRPDIVFLDIEMPFGNAFDLLEQVEEIDFETIFVTAYDNYAIQAINRSAAFYLLKPVDIDELVEAVEKIKKEKEQADYVTHAKVLAENIRIAAKQEQKLMLPTLSGFDIIKAKEVVNCSAEDNLTRFFLLDGSEKLICRTLKYYEEVLEELGFCRVHRSHLVNLEHVASYTKGKGGYLTLTNGKMVEVSNSKKENFLSRF